MRNKPVVTLLLLCVVATCSCSRGGSVVLRPDPTPVRLQPLQQSLVQMGQPAFSAPSPEGWPDTAADWAGPDALVKRLNWATTVGEAAQNMDPVAVAAGALGPRLTERSRLAVARAGSRSEALTLFLMSPEFQRR